MLFFRIFYFIFAVSNYKNMKTITALLVATLGMNTDNYLIMTGSILVVIYLIVKK